MVEYTYYCKVTHDRVDIKPGVYKFSGVRANTLGYNRLVTLSDKIWRQGPKGGVKIVKDRHSYYSSQYVTSNEKHMKEFMWVKLQAQTFIKG